LVRSISLHDTAHRFGVDSPQFEFPTFFFRVTASLPMEGPFSRTFATPFSSLYSPPVPIQTKATPPPLPFTRKTFPPSSGSALHHLPGFSSFVFVDFLRRFRLRAGGSPEADLTDLFFFFCSVFLFEVSPPLGAGLLLTFPPVKEPRSFSSYRRNNLSIFSLQCLLVI